MSAVSLTNAHRHKHHLSGVLVCRSEVVSVCTIWNDKYIFRTTVLTEFTCERRETHVCTDLPCLQGEEAPGGRQGEDPWDGGEEDLVRGSQEEEEGAA